MKKQTNAKRPSKQNVAKKHSLWIVGAIVIVIAIIAGILLFSGRGQNQETTGTVFYTGMYEISMIYDDAGGYSWYVKNPEKLKIAKLMSVNRAPGAKGATEIKNPYTQTFVFQLINPKIKYETVTLEYKHYSKKDSRDSEATHSFDLRPENFRNPVAINAEQ